MVVVAGAKVASDILVPVILAMFIAVMVSPLLRWFIERRVPFVVAFFAVLGLVLSAAAGVGYLLGDSIADVSRRIPEFERTLEQKLEGIFVWLRAYGVEIERTELLDTVDAQAIVKLLGGTISALGAVISNVVFVIVTLAFMLSEVAGLPRKLRLALELEADAPLESSRVVEDIQRYLKVKTRVSALTGVGAWLILGVVGVEYAFLWALLAFLFNYIPQIGSLVAAVPPVLVAWVQFDGATALSIAAAYVVLNGILGTFLEPRWMGKTFGISVLVVFLSLLFWGWLWGPVGMLLAVPLTMIVKILLGHDDNTRWISILLGSGKEMRQLDRTGESGGCGDSIEEES